MKTKTILAAAVIDLFVIVMLVTYSTYAYKEIKKLRIGILLEQNQKQKVKEISVIKYKVKIEREYIKQPVDNYSDLINALQKKNEKPSGYEALLEQLKKAGTKETITIEKDESGAAQAIQSSPDNWTAGVKYNSNGYFGADLSKRIFKKLKIGAGANTDKSLELRAALDFQ